MSNVRKIRDRLRGFHISKRQEYVFITAILTFGLFALQLVPEEFRFWFILALTVSTYILSLLGLRENMSGLRWVLLPLLPTLFTVAVSLFYFLLPIRWLTRLPSAVFYAVGIYAILLVENIFNVALNRSIQLIRVANAVGFLATLATLFLLLNTVFSLRLTVLFNMLLVSVIIFPLVLQSLWSTALTERVERAVLLYAIFFTVALTEVVFAISFWPIRPIMASLLVTTVSYVLLNIGHHYFAKRLFAQNVVEFVRVFAIVFILILLTTQYR